MDNSKLMEEVSALKLAVQELTIRVEAIENGERGNGVFLDGTSDLIAEYIKTASKKEGE